MKILGIDPGLERTGWGVIEQQGSRLIFIACGVIKSTAAEKLAVRLNRIDDELSHIVKLWAPDCAAIEETFVNKNALSSLKLGQARGVAIVAPARAGLDVFEYPANLVKKTIVGAGHAGKDQVGMMIKVLLPLATPHSADEADALAVAICHAHHM